MPPEPRYRGAMRLSDRRWRIVALLPVLAGTALTVGETVMAAGGPVPTLAGIQPGLIGVVLIVAGGLLFIVSQRAANAADPDPPR